MERERETQGATNSDRLQSLAWAIRAGNLMGKASQNDAAAIEHVLAALNQIASWDDGAMARASTLHYDMRGTARAALAEKEQPHEQAK